MSFSVKAMLKNGDKIFKNFYDNRYDIEHITVYWSRFWHKRPDGLLFDAPKILHKYKYNGSFIYPEFVNKETVLYEYDVDSSKYVPIIQFAIGRTMKNPREAILGVRLFLDKIYIFNDISKEIVTQERT